MATDGRREGEEGRGGDSPRPSPLSEQEQRMPEALGLSVWMLVGSFSGGMLGGFLGVAQRGPSLLYSSPIRDPGGIPDWIAPWGAAAACVLALSAGALVTLFRREWVSVLALLVPAVYSFVAYFGATAFAPAPLFALGGGLGLPAVAALLAVLAPFRGPYAKSLRIAVLAGSMIVVLVHLALFFILLTLFVGAG